MDYDQQPPGQWNTGSLYEHFSVVLEEQEKARQTAFRDLQAQIDRRITVTEEERQQAEEYLKALITAGDERLQAHVEAQKEAVTEARRNIDKRLDAMNELRQAVEEDRRLFMGRTEIESKIAGVLEQLSRAEGNLREAIERSEEAQNRRDDQLAERVKRLESALDTQRGGQEVERRRQQTTQPWQLWAAGAFLAIALYVVGYLTGSPGM